MTPINKKFSLRNNVYPLYLGITVSILLVFSSFRPGNFPICYAVLVFFTVLGLLKVKKFKLPHSARNPLIIYTLLCIYVTIRSATDSSLILSNIVVNSAGILTAVLILNFVRNEGNLVYFILGAAPLMILDGLIGIGQFFYIPGVNDFARFFVTSSSSMLEFEHQLSTTRIWGLQLNAHGFAYDQLVWGLMLVTTLLAIKTKRIRGKGFFLTLILLISMAVIFLTSQRSIVYPFFAAAIFLFLGNKGKGKWKIALLVLLAAIFIMRNISLPDRTSIKRLTNLTIKEGRRAQYKEAFRIISKDPLLGTAYEEEYDLEKSIHNGILNGWARFGFLWMILFLITLGLTYMHIMKSDVDRWHKLAALAVLFVILVNILFHTHTPGKSAMNFPIVLGYIFCFLGVYDRKQQNRLKGHL